MAKNICAILVVSVAAGCATSNPGRAAGRARVVRWHDVVAANPLGPGEIMRNTQIEKGSRLSVHIIQVRDGKGVAHHHHASHDETVLVLVGNGVMELGDRKVEVETGSVVHVPAGTRHSFRNLSRSIAIAMSFFTPPFSGADRVIQK